MVSQANDIINNQPLSIIITVFMKGTVPTTTKPFVHSVTFESSGGKKTGRPLRKSLGMMCGTAKTDNPYANFRKQSDISSLSSFFGTAKGIGHKDSFSDSISLQRRCSLSTSLPLPPNVIHINLKSLEPSPKNDAFEEIKGVPLVNAMERMSVMSTNSETPSRHCESSKSTASAYKEEDSHTEFGHYWGALHKSPSLLKLSQKELSKIVACVTTLDVPPQFSIRSHTPAAKKAYKEFLFYMFESICLVKQISPFLVEIPIEMHVNIPRPLALYSMKY